VAADWTDHDEELDTTLIRHGLIDEFRFSLFPLVVGTGRRLFEGIDTSA
jgi:dihydrofolate reductase